MLLTMNKPALLFLLSSLLLIPQLLAHISGPSPVCRNDTATYTYPFISPPEVEYHWSVSGGYVNYSDNHIMKATWTNPGTGIVYLTIIEKAGGTVFATDTMHVMVLQDPAPFITTDYETSCYLESEGGELVPDPDVCKLVCQGAVVRYETPLNAGSSYQWVVSGHTSFTPNSNEVEITWPFTRGSGSVKVVETTADGCVEEKEICIGIIESPQAFFNSTAELISTSPLRYQACQLQSIAFIDSSIGVAKWYWDFGDGNTSNAPNPSHAYLSSGTFDGMLIVENNCGCVDTLEFQVEINDSEGPDISCISTLCAGQGDVYTTSLSCSPYVWEVEGGTITGGQGTQTITVNWNNPSSGYGIVSLEAHSDCGMCTVPVKLKVPIITNNVVQIKGDSIACQQSQGIYSIPPAPGAIYTWQVSGGTFAMNASATLQDANLNKVAVNWGSATTGSLSVIYDNPILGCSDTLFMSVALKETFAITGDTNVCVGPGYTYTAPSGSYSWKLIAPDGNQVGSTVSGSNASFSFPSEGEYTVIASDNGNAFCNPQAKLKVMSVGTPPTPGPPSGDTLICPDAYYQYSGAPAGSRYALKWEFQNGTPDSSYGENALVKWSGSGPWSIRLYQLDVNKPHCMSDSAELIVQHRPNPQPPITAPDTGCANGFSTISTTQEADRYEWAIVPPQMGSIYAGQYTSNISIQWNNAPGNAQVVLATKVCDSTNSNSKNIYIKPQPKPVLSGPATICRSSQVSFTETTNHPTSTAWEWDFGDGATTTTYTNAAQHTYEQDGTYIVTVTVSYSGICTFSKTVAGSYEVHDLPPALLTADSITNLCPPKHGDTVTDIKLHIPIHATSGYSFQWYKDGGSLTSGVTEYEPGVGGMGTYQVKVTDNSTGCFAWSDTLRIDSCLVDTLAQLGGDPCPVSSGFQNTIDFGYALDYDVCGKVNFSPMTNGGTVAAWRYNYPHSGGSVDNHYVYNSSGFYQVQMTVVFSFMGGSCSVDTVKTIEVPFYGDYNIGYECASGGNVMVVLNSTSNYTSDPIVEIDYFFLNLPGPGSSFHYNSTGDMSIPKAPGTYELRMSPLTNTSYCIVKDTIVVPAGGDADFNIATGPYCEGTPVLFSDASTGNIIDYAWNFQDGSASNLQDAYRTYNGVSSPNELFLVKLLTTDFMGCQDSLTKSLTVNGNLLSNGNAIISPDPVPMICYGDSISLIRDLQLQNTTIVSQLWSTQQTTSSIYAKNTGFYWVDVKDNKNCREITEYTSVGVCPSPGARIFGGRQYCPGEKIRLNQFRGDSYSYTWLKNGAYFSTGAELTDVIYAPGPVTYGAIVDDGICSDTTYEVITILSAPAITSFAASPDNCSGSEPEISVTASGNSPFTYNWSSGKTGSSLQVKTGGLYKITVTDANGCVSDTSMRIYQPPHFDNVMTGCYTFCTDILPISWQGLGSYGYGHSWHDQLTDPTTSAYPLSSSGQYGMYLQGSDNGCAANSKDIEINLINCAECSQVAAPVIDSVWCIGPDTLGGDWLYGFSYSHTYNYPSAWLTITAKGGQVLNLNSNQLVFGSNTITGEFVRTDPSLDTLCLEITVDASPDAPGICRFTLCDTLDFCPEYCEMEVDWRRRGEPVCIGNTVKGTNLFYFQAEVNSGNTYPWKMSLSSTHNGKIKQLNPITEVVNGLNLVRGIWEVDSALTEDRCLYFNFQNPYSDECCYFELCLGAGEMEEGCDPAPSCNFPFSYGIGNIGNNNASDTVWYTFWGYLYNPFPVNAHYYIATKDATLLGATPKRFNPSPSSTLLRMIISDEDPPPGPEYELTILLLNPAGPNSCQQDKTMLNGAGTVQEQPDDCGDNPGITVVSSEITCLGDAGGSAPMSYLFELVVEFPPGLGSWPVFGAQSQGGYIVELAPTTIGSLVYSRQEISFIYHTTSPSSFAAIEFFMAGVTGVTETHCDFEWIFLLPDCCTGPMRLAAPPGPYRDREEQESGTDFQAGDLLSVYPNPAGESATAAYRFSAEQGNRLLVLDSYQRQVMEVSSLGEQGSLRLSTAQWKAGLYFVIAIDASGQREMKKLVVTH